MIRTIFCTFLQREEEGLGCPTYPGEIGKQIFNTISKEAWSKWMSKQTILINENQLSTKTMKDRKLLEKEMINFLFKGK